MAVRVNPGYRRQLLTHLFTEMAANDERERIGKSSYTSDLCDWAERNFYIPLTGEPVKLPLHQKAIFRYFFTRREDNHFPFQTLVYSTVKKSGKSTSAGIIARWFAETQSRYGEIFTIGNDLDQAKDRSFKEVIRSLEMTPGYNKARGVLPGRWEAHKLSIKCLLTGGVIKAIAVDASGEAGGQPALTVWTELWGAENDDAKRFWDEMTPINTIPDSLRLVETYAGYEGESELLRGLYDLGLDGRQLTAGELAEFVCREDRPGESYQDFINCWHETEGDPNAHIPIWVNKDASFAMYWDMGQNARRMPWQHMFQPLDENDVDDKFICKICRRIRSEHEINGTSDQYYIAQEKILPPQAFRRLHFNEWVGAESSFIPMELWDACGEIHKIAPLVDHETTPLVMSADAAVTGDCFGTLAVERCPYDNECVDVRAVKKWDPKEKGGVINLSEPEAFLKACHKTYNIVQITYDPYQMENSAQRLYSQDGIWMEPFNQVGDRLKADSQLYDLILNKRVHYSHAEGCPKGLLCNCPLGHLREHIANANSRVQKDEDSKLRIVKKSSGKKIDLTICLSMAAFKCLYLRLDRTKLLEKVGW